jgi:gamma-glutamylcyclotransferase (GGCT)/AIG2-like uncharacterized protein YtfP
MLAVTSSIVATAHHRTTHYDKRSRSGARLTMFFYGTLKRGNANHDLFCQGYLRVEEASVRGQL